MNVIVELCHKQASNHSGNSRKLGTPGEESRSQETDLSSHLVVRHLLFHDVLEDFTALLQLSGLIKVTSFSRWVVSGRVLASLDS